MCVCDGGLYRERVSWRLGFLAELSMAGFVVYCGSKSLNVEFLVQVNIEPLGTIIFKLWQNSIFVTNFSNITGRLEFDFFIYIFYKKYRYTRSIVKSKSSRNIISVKLFAIQLWLF